MSGRDIRQRARSLKRPHPLLQDMDESAIEISTDYLCSVCLDCLDEPHMTQCGHTFCKDCIIKSIQTNHRCPKCTYIINNTDQVFPNHIVNVQLRKYKRSLSLSKSLITNNNKKAFAEISEYLTSQMGNLESQDLSRMITILKERKGALEANSEYTKYHLLRTFLSDLDEKKDHQLATIERESKLIKTDLANVEHQLLIYENSEGHEGSSSKQLDIVPNSSNLNVQDLDTDTTMGTEIGVSEKIPDEGFNVPHNKPESTSEALNVRTKRIRTHFSELSDYYFSLRVPGVMLDPGEGTGNFNRLGNCVSKFTRYSSMRALATIDAGDRNHASSNIASSIEFDKDSEFFAVAGLTKKIRIFDYSHVILDSVDMHYPCGEMLCDSKISCVCWSTYQKSMLVSSDYDGTVSVWDTATTKKLHVYQEHQKRCWSVDFNKMDTKIIASGSDDAKVKLWHLDKDRSVFTLEAKANVCCVQFNPLSRYHLAFGSADHCVHYYDLRNPKEPLVVFKGHKKAVSYVKFISNEELISASTDSHLKVWNVGDANCVQSLQGHVNEKNFVGLATDGEFVACGSENNSLYVYYKELPRKLFSYKFDNRKLLIDQEPKEDDSTEFVSAVAWRKGSDVIAAGNSLGIIKILQMV